VINLASAGNCGYKLKDSGGPGRDEAERGAGVLAHTTISGALGSEVCLTDVSFKRWGKPLGRFLWSASCE